MISEETWDEVLGAIGDGMSNKDAIIYAGVSESQFYQRVKDNTDFSESVKKAQVKFKHHHVRNITNAAKTQWPASAWLLERKFKEEYGKVSMSREVDKGEFDEITVFELPNNGREKEEKEED